MLAILLAPGLFQARGEAMLELFNTPWAKITQKMPELAEAGYDSLWVPNPAKGDSGTNSVGYDPYDRFDLGNKNQRGNVQTAYGTEAELLQMVVTAHRFGIRVYFDNVMNHNGGTVPGFNANTPTNYYPGFTVQDFHLQTSGKYYVAWPSLGSSDPTEPYFGGNDYCDQWRVQNYTLLGLVDIANEPGTVNDNFGATAANSTNKPLFIRQPLNPEYYMDTNGVSLGGGLHPFNGTNGEPVPEYADQFLDRAIAWELYTTKCDGFRLDAVKHVPYTFFSTTSSLTDDPSFSGYLGAIQAMYDAVHGYGNNVLKNGYVETDGNRNSLFNTEASRNDAMIFGEHVSTPPDYQDYINAGMRLCNQPLYSQFYSAMTGGSLAGMDGRDYSSSAESPCGEGPFPTYSAAQGVNFSMTQDGGSCCPPNAAMEDAWDFMHEGLPMFYTDGYNHAPGGFPNNAYNNYLGEFGDNRIPDTAYTHNQAARGGTWSRWSDKNIVLFERYDYREGTNTLPQYQDVALFGMNSLTNTFPSDIFFDDGVSRTSDGYYLVHTNTVDGSASANTNPSGSVSRGVGIVVGFPPGSVLVQLASSAEVSGGKRAYHRLLVHGATTSLSTAQSSANATDPTQRLIYTGGQTLASGGGAIELVIPSGSWVIYGYQWPEASRANPATNAIVFIQGGSPVPTVTVYRTDGVDGDTAYSPTFPFKMRGSVDTFTGNAVKAPGEGNVSNFTYAIQMPVLTNGPFDIVVRDDASAANTLVKLDGGMDLNSQMGLGATNGYVGPNGPDLRDNPPGVATDPFLGYEQTAFQFRDGPEKFAARNIASNTLVSIGAETYYYTIGGTNSVVSGSGINGSVTNNTATWVYHDPNAPTTIVTNGALPVTPATQMAPTNPAAGAPVNVYVKVGYQFNINTCYLYYTTNGTNPEGDFGVGKATTQVVQGNFVNHDSSTNNIDWWVATIPGQPVGTQVRYKIGLFNGGSYGFAIGNPTNWPSIPPITDALPVAKVYGLTQMAITNFNPTKAVVWLHNDLNTNNTQIGLSSGYHIARARTYLPRTNESSVYNTFAQTFYYDAGPPAGVFVNPAPVGATISNATYQVIVRADSSATELDYNIADSNTNNDDALTGQNNGNGPTNGVPKFVAVAPTTPTASLNTTYSNYPVEFHFNYVAVPTNGTATIVIKLKEATTAIFPNRVTLLTNIVNTAAPSQYIQISDPPSDGLTLVMGPTTTYTINACFSSTLAGAANINYFSIFINGVFQPRQDGFGDPQYTVDPTDTNCGPGLNVLSYDWAGALPGTNVIQVLYTNNLLLTDTRTVIVEAPPTITGILPGTGSQYITWSSYPDQYYQVLSTTNLLDPFQPLGTPIPGDAGTATFTDTNQDPMRFYQIQVVQ